MRLPRLPLKGGAYHCAENLHGRIILRYSRSRPVAAGTALVVALVTHLKPD
jgi:hypothetical protein